MAQSPETNTDHQARANPPGARTEKAVADKAAGAFTRPAEPLMRIHRSLKQAFDPAGVFNRGRLYADF